MGLLGVYKSKVRRRLCMPVFSKAPDPETLPSCPIWYIHAYTEDPDHHLEPILVCSQSQSWLKRIQTEHGAGFENFKHHVTNRPSPFQAPRFREWWDPSCTVLPRLGVPVRHKSGRWSQPDPSCPPPEDSYSPPFLSASSSSASLPDQRSNSPAVIIAKHREHHAIS